jgi:hypothetical protein
MLRKVLYAITLGGVLAAAHPVFADPPASAVAEHAQAAPPATQQTASTAPALSSSSTETVPARNQSQTDAPVGFGWG